VSSDAVPAAAPAPGGPTVLRPSRAAYARAVQANLWIAIPLLVVTLLRIALNWWLLPVFVVAIGGAFAGVALYFRNARVEYGDGTYTGVSMFGARRTFTAAQAGTVVTVTSLQSVGVSRTAPQLIVVGDDGAKLLRLRGQTWDVEQFTELAVDMMQRGVSNDAIREPITPGQLRARYPRAVSWFEAHPIAWGLLLGLGIVVVIVAIAIAVVFSVG
jgi:hypothetical protein